MHRVSTRIPEKEYRGLEEIGAEWGLVLTEGHNVGETAIGRTIERLVREAMERRTKEPTLMALVKSDPGRARSLVLAAMTMADGNSESARAALGHAIGRSGEVSERDWRSTREALDVDPEFKRLWPKRRG